MSDAALSLSIVIPAYNAANTIAATLDSLGDIAPADEVEVLVVDDGSRDPDLLRSVVSAYPAVRLIAHGDNRGMCAARNSGIAASRGTMVTILDADDVFAADWRTVFRGIMQRLPASANLCFSACRAPDGRSTVRDPSFEGWLDTRTFLLDRYAGEYLPIFRGDYVRAKPYVDLGFRKSCGNLSYLAWLQDGPIYIVPDVIRIYHDSRAGSVTDTVLQRNRAIENMRCLEEELDRFADLYRNEAPGLLERKLLRLAVYARLAGDSCAWRFFRRGASFRAPVETLGGLLMMIGGPATGSLVRLSKRFGVIKRYG